MIQRLLSSCVLALVMLAVTPVFAEPVLVAVAANFIPPFREIALEFEKSTGHQVQVVGGSSGNFYTQIQNGAPFDVFFSADNERPKSWRTRDWGSKIPDSPMPGAGSSCGVQRPT